MSSAWGSGKDGVGTRLGYLGDRGKEVDSAGGRHDISRCGDSKVVGCPLISI